MTIPSPKKTQNHPFHLVSPSPWPAMGAISAFITAIGLILLMHHHGSIPLMIGGILIILTMIGWWRDVLRESNTKGIYTPLVQHGLRVGVILFILSEIMFFLAFFWAFFNSSLFPAASIDFHWPPKNIHPIEAFDWPYLNTLLLLLSGTTLTWGHQAFLEGKKVDTLKGLGLTILLGFLFTCVQAYEYAHAGFDFKGGIYPSIFYMITGFHGVHVIIGAIFLSVTWVQVYKDQFTLKGHIGFESASWYWHFVDVIWLLLFVLVYWWGA